MTRHNLIVTLISVAFLGFASSAQTMQSFPEDPLVDTSGHFIYNTFMQFDAISANNLHYAIDIAGEEYQTVKPGLPSGENCKILGEGTDFRLLIARRKQDGNWACFRAQHIYPNPRFSAGDWLSHDDTLGTLNSERHLHAEFNLSPDEWIENEDLRNPEIYAFENAPWLADSQVPVVDSLVFHLGSPDTLQIWVHDTTNGSSEYYNGIYKLLLKVNDNPVDSLVFDKYRAKDGTYPPTASEFYFDTNTPPSGYNNPNVLNYKLIGEISSNSWRVAWFDASGNYGESDPVDPPRAPSGQMAGFVRDDKMHLMWRVESIRNLRHFNVLESLRETGGYEQINEEPILTVAGQVDYEFLAELPEEWDQIWYRVMAKDVYNTDYLLAQQSFEFPYPLMTNVRTWPNPSGTHFQMELQIARKDYGRVEVFNPAGRKVRTLYEGELKRGTLYYSWDRRDDKGRDVSQGVYLLRIETRGTEKSPAELFVRKLIVLR